MKKIINKKERGITLIALVVTIIVLIVLAGISINLIFGNFGVITKEKEAKEESLKQTAKEVMNLKITSIQIENYTENKTLPSLQFLANKLCEDSDMEYVLAQSKAHASLDKIDTTNLSSIYTKLKEYPYEFEINDSLQLASIDGVKIADNNKDGTVTLTQEQYNSILNRLSTLENETNKNENYSLEEQVIGKWIDGKNIYRKTITGSTLPKNGETLISNVDNVIDAYGEQLFKNTIWFHFPYSSTKDYLRWELYNTDNTLRACTTVDPNNTTAYKWTFEYTKTTD